MKRLMPVLLVLVAGACADYNPALVILKMQVPDREMCLVPAEEDDLYLATGVLDVSCGRGYILTPLLRNGANAGALNDNIVYLTRAQNEVSLADGTALGAHDQLISGSVEPSGVVATGYYGITAESAASFGIEVGGNVQAVVRTRVIGEMEGSEITTQWFDFPVTLCNGCVLQDRAVCPSFRCQF